MKQKTSGETSNKRSGSGIIFLILALFFLLPGILVFGYYGWTYLPVRQTTDILPWEVMIGTDASHCTLDIPSGTLSIRHPEHTLIGSSYQVKAEIQLERPLRFIRCEGTLPNWNLSLEAQTTLIGASVEPNSTILQPAVEREHFAFEWTFTPEETVPEYQSHLWLRAIVNQQEEIVERWNILVRDFPLENIALFGQPTIFWLIGAGFSCTFGILFLILFIQKRHNLNHAK